MVCMCVLYSMCGMVCVCCMVCVLYSMCGMVCECCMVCIV